jgi:hypothetical protein
MLQHKQGMRRLCLGIVALLFACGKDEETCNPVANSGCEDDQVCEVVQGGEPACFGALEVRGKVIDLATDAGVSGARIVAVDVNGAAASGVAISASDGTYALVIPATRNADGTLAAAFSVTLRADAAGYDSFPGVVRQPLPLDLATAVLTEEKLVLQSAVTDIGMIADPGAGAGSISGTVDVPEDGVGVLVVAETTTGPQTIGSAVIAARDGGYEIFNLQPGRYVVTAYAVGHVYGTAELDVAAANVDAANIPLTADAPGTITGSVSIVNGGGASATSIVAFVESTFDPVTGRGVPPPGLRAPRTGVPDVTGAFTLEGVPPGRYVLVAAFENDGLVRDPDTCIAGTDDIHIAVTAGGTVTPEGFKITGALAIMSPGANGAEMVTGAPTFKWEDDSGEDEYIVEVFDAFGQLVHTKTIPGVSGGDPTLAYDGPALESGMFYQWRATSLKTSGGGGGACELSRTEDLKGVFFLP